ncbi:hypothetical protein ACFSC6_22570 [Rufibacter sediminis]|uniref:Secretion system C-terminal sorting domain-containing protein n=1 Tax=Rufibacter sediminis TaxID=2762756 RepID=A0ABR6VS14_9BACT|nr:hypothetical protein [Rufibacter sediminis]MBC3539376.1 hypothetical protein [Rufibacter sediminis]
MIRTFTRLKEVVCLALSLVLVSGGMSSSYGTSLFIKGEHLKTTQSILSISNLTWMAKGLGVTSVEDSTAAGKTYYWVPFGTNNRGSGAWSEIGHWATTSGGKEKHQTLPTAVDNVVFDINSFLFTGQKVTLDKEANVNNISWNGIRATNFDGNGQTLNVHGAVQANLDLTFTGTKGFFLNLKSEAENTPVNFEGRLFAPGTVLTFDGSGSWDLKSQIRVSANGTINLNQGTLKTNGYPLSINAFNSVGDNARSLDLGSSALDNLSSWNVSPSLNLKADSAAFTLNGPETHIFNGGGKSYRLVTLYGPQSYVNQSNTFKSITLPKAEVATESNTLVLEAGQSQTIESLFTFGEGTITNIQSSVLGQTANLNFSSYGFCTDYLTISDVTATGRGAYYAGLSSRSIGNTNGWNFLGCGSTIYSPKSTTDFDACKSSAAVVSTGSGIWQEVKLEGEVVASINDGGNSLGEVAIDFVVSANNARPLINAETAQVQALARNWRIRSAVAPSADKPVKIRFYGLQSEVEAYKTSVTAVSSLNDLSFTTYSSAGTSENCDYTDNVEAGSSTNHVTTATFSSTGNYFTAELTGITDFTEYYLHNGSSAIDFVASKPVVEIPEPDEEIEPVEDSVNCDMIKLKWFSKPRSKFISYEVEVATDLLKNDFKIIGKFQRKVALDQSQAFELQDSKKGQETVRYYRLKMYDAKGRKYYSRIILVRFNCGVQVVQASPNPFNDHLKLTVNTPKAGDLNIKLLSSNGKESLFERVMVPKGKSETEIRIDPRMKPGMYYLFTELNGKITSLRLLKK